ncbi:hypothetical protein D9M69_432400 [compost metagenome]
MLETPATQVGRARERAFLVAEQFGFHQVFGDRRHVQRNERRSGARAVAMQRVGHQFFTGTRFTIDQHGDVGVAQASDGAKHFLHRRRFADDFRGAGQGRGNFQALLFLSVLVGALDQGNRFINVERLGQVLEGAALIGRDSAVQIGVRGHDDHWQPRVLFANPRQKLQTAGAGHADVGDDHVRLLARQTAHHAIGAVEALRGHAFLLQGFFQDPTDRTVVIDDPHGFTTAHVDVAPCSSGRKIEKVVWPGWLSHSIRPWCWLMMFWVMARPSPVPSGRPLTMGKKMVS